MWRVGGGGGYARVKAECAGGGCAAPLASSYAERVNVQGGGTRGDEKSKAECMEVEAECGGGGCAAPPASFHAEWPTCRKWGWG
jgi:hypothetical protein